MIGINGKTDNPDWTRDYSDPSTVAERGRSWRVERQTHQQTSRLGEILKKSEKSVE